MRKKTHTNPLSRREIELLRNNPHIASVTENTVRFTEEFKKLAYEQKAKGVPVAETMRRCGIDPEILGASRVEGFSYTLSKKAKQESALRMDAEKITDARPRQGKKQWSGASGSWKTNWRTHGRRSSS